MRIAVRSRLPVERLRRLATAAAAERAAWARRGMDGEDPMALWSLPASSMLGKLGSGASGLSEASQEDGIAGTGLYEN